MHQPFCSNLYALTCLDRKWAEQQRLSLLLQNPHTWAASGRNISHGRWGFFNKKWKQIPSFFSWYIAGYFLNTMYLKMLMLKQKRVLHMEYGPHCMVMCRPTYISGPARNGSIPPITLTDGPGQGSSMFHM